MQKIYPGRILKKLANLQLAIFLLLSIGIVVAIGTIIEQEQSLAFYQQNYPETNPVAGFNKDRAPAVRLRVSKNTQQ